MSGDVSDTLLVFIALRYSELRLSDFRSVIRHMQQSMQNEEGEHRSRPSACKWATWVAIAGGHVHGVADDTQQEFVRQGKLSFGNKDEPMGDLGATLTSDERAAFTHCWPLQRVDVADEEQMSLLYKVLCTSARMQHELLCRLSFPDTMEFQEAKLSACGQEIGGSLLFGRRLGFSGTVSTNTRRHTLMSGDIFDTLLVFTA